MDKVVGLTVLIPKDLYLTVVKDAERKDTTISGVVQVAIRSYFGGDGPEYPRLFRGPVAAVMCGERSVESEGELFAYLLTLAKIWYRPGVLGSSVINKIAELSSFWEKLDIRFAEDLLRESGEIAEALSDDKITIRHVNMAYNHWLPLNSEKAL